MSWRFSEQGLDTSKIKSFLQAMKVEQEFPALASNPLPLSVDYSTTMAALYSSNRAANSQVANSKSQQKKGQSVSVNIPLFAQENKEEKQVTPEFLLIVALSK
ncbi:hypothetical protein K435DRAFT_871192 [Dendrothele bispora CBS 962.96]|uniref:Uncharacterized protein n=1 Tax=Dendrothele bispora (strain CBS 962.96) TaxID=1314807 RepID=A0A4S8L4M9_DENBC|nr:hypothetical protein K435DRAFT_871192 [Dendrothele bispora CBS 962.96]